MALTLDVGLTLAALAGINAWLGIKFSEKEETGGLSLAFFFLSQLFLFADLFFIATLAVDTAAIAVGWNMVTLMSLLYAAFTIYIMIALVRVGFNFLVGTAQQNKSDKNRIDYGRHRPR